MILSELIATKLSTGLEHPGDGKDQAPMTIRLPMFRTVGSNPALTKQVDLTVKLISEAIVYLIETEGNCDIVPRGEQA